MTQKRIINKVLVTDISPHEFEMSLSNLQLHIQEWINRHGPDAKLEYDRYHYEPYENDPNPIFRITRDFVETDDELNSRIQTELLRKNEQDVSEREEYERLQKKFGKK